MKNYYLLGLILFFTGIYSMNVTKINEFCKSESFRAHQSNTIFYNDHLFVLSTRGLQIYEKEGSNFNQIGFVDLPEQSYIMDHCEDIFYCVTGFGENLVHRIDCTDYTNPILTDTFEGCIGSQSLFCNSNYIFISDYTFYPAGLHLYRSEPFEYLGLYTDTIYPGNLDKIKDDLAISYADHYIILVDISDPFDMEVFGSVHCPNLMAPLFITMVNDSVMAVNTSDGCQFIDISNLNNPFTITQFQASDPDPFNYASGTRLVNFGDYDGFRIYDISDLDNIELTNSIQNNKPYINCIFQDDLIILVSMMGELDVFTDNGNQVEYVNSLGHYGQLVRFTINQNDCYVYTYGSGIVHWDISNFEDPILENIYNEDSMNSMFLRSNNNYISNYIYNPDSGNYEIEILKIEESGILQTIYSEPFIPGENEILFADNDNHFFTILNGNFMRYSVNQQNELILEDETSIPCNEFAQIYIFNNSAYLTYYGHLIIINNIYNDLDEVSIETFQGDYNMYSRLDSYNDYVFISCELENGYMTSIYMRDSNNSHSLFCTIEDSGVLEIDENNSLLFLANLDCSIFDISDLDNGVINEIYTLDNWNYADWLQVVNRDDQNYLFFLERTSVTIYEYDPEGSDIEDDVISLHNQITNYPNPISNGGSTREVGTNIAMNIEDLTKQYVVDIYNTKGQLVRSFKVDTSVRKNVFSIYWDGKDKNKTKVGSGVYFISLSDGRDVIASKKCMVLK